MTKRHALLIADAHLLDLVTLLAVLPLYSASGEYGLGFGAIYPVAGIMGVIALKAAGIGLLVAAVGKQVERKTWIGRTPVLLALAVSSGLLCTATNTIAYTVIR